MESPASRLVRLISGFVLCLLVVVAIAIMEAGGSATSELRVILPSLIAAIAGILLVAIAAGGDRSHGKWPTDSWFSREAEDMMISRIERERDEASMQDLGSKWARMEMEHLESKHSEE